MRRASLGAWLAANEDIDRLDRELLAAKVLAVSRAKVIASPETILTLEAERTLNELANRHRRDEPLAYILGEKDFFGFRLEVNPRVMIPRPETEQLVEIAIAQAPWGARILDLGTGSGCIAVAIKGCRPGLHVTATDLSNRALTTAARNAVAHSLSIHFLQSDWFSAVQGQFDCIVANPPYVADAEAASGPLAYEPRMALASGIQGFNALGVIIDQASPYLAANAWLCLEHGHQQGDAVAAHMHRNGFALVATKTDLAGHPRVTMGQKTG